MSEVTYLQAGKETLRTDGRAVDLVAAKAYTKGDVVYQNGFHGIAMNTVAQGDNFAVEIAQRVHILAATTALSGIAVGDGIYIDANGDLTKDAETEGVANHLAFKVVAIDSANGTIDALILPQSV